MATKEQLELQVKDLERDVDVLVKALRDIYVAATKADYSHSPELETAPAYLLGYIASTAKFAPANMVTVQLSQYLELLDAAAV